MAQNYTYRFGLRVPGVGVTILLRTETASKAELPAASAKAALEAAPEIAAGAELLLLTYRRLNRRTTAMDWRHDGQGEPAVPIREDVMVGGKARRELPGDVAERIGGLARLSRLSVPTETGR